AKIEFSKKGPQVMLGGNIDTFPMNSGWTKSPFKPIETNGRLYGLGAKDSKVGLATLITIFKELNQAPVSLRGTLVLGCFSDGKGWSTGVNTILEQGILKDLNACIMCKPTPQNSILIGRLGRVLIRGRIRKKKQNKPPHKRNNVILNSASFITAISAIKFKPHSQYQVQGEISPREIHAKPLGSIEPETCEFTFDTYYPPNEAIPKILTKMKRVLNLSKTNLEGRISLLPMPTPPPKPYLLKPNHQLVQVIGEAYEKTLSKKPNYFVGKQSGDENYLHHAQIPTITFGPNGSDIGSPDEFVEIESVEPTAHIITRAVLNLMK
ncbi:MAG: M20/M25/M40 family metallo-hydrolase, partial [Candidatus Ranarchaeia archaeon]